MFDHLFFGDYFKNKQKQINLGELTLKQGFSGKKTHSPGIWVGNPRKFPHLGRRGRFAAGSAARSVNRSDNSDSSSASGGVAGDGTASPSSENLRLRLSTGACGLEHQRGTVESFNGLG